MYDTTKPYKSRVLDLIRTTWQTPYLQVSEGSYPILTATHGYPEEVDHTDGIGTKGKLHWERRTFRSAVQDALAMNLNDLLTIGARAYKLQNHLILPQDDHGAILAVVEALCDLCRGHGIAVTGGETSIQNNIQGMELSLTVSAFVPERVVNCAQEGDYVVGLASSGPHSNGYTLLQQLISPPDTPTLIYDRPKVPRHALVHLAGGAYTRLLSILPEGLYLDLCPAAEPRQGFWTMVYERLAATSPDPDRQMYSTFNCGFGMVMCLAPADYRPDCGVIIGMVRGGEKRVAIRSGFSRNRFNL